MGDERPVLGAFELTHRVASGGFGDVWRGANRHTGVAVGVKVLHRVPDAAALEAFELEVSNMARLDHPNIVAPHDFGLVSEGTAQALEVQPGAPWFCATWIEGGTLEGLQPELPTVRRWLADLCAALAHAHSRGVLHLDLKNANVLLSPAGSAVLTDFGIAMRIGTSTEQTAGSPGFMAPEQIVGGALSPATDLYALGCTAWTLLTGSPPFGDQPLFERLSRHVSTPIVPPPDLPAPVRSWLLRCLAKRSDDRFQHGMDALDALWEPILHDTDRPSAPDEATSRGPTTWATEAVDQPAAAEPGPPAIRAMPIDRPAEGLRPLLSIRSRSQRLVGSERSLWARVALPTLGREVERDALWAFALEVEKRGEPGLLVIEGPPGSGRGQLAEWLSWTLAEHGAVSTQAVPAQTTRLTVVQTAPIAVEAKGPVLQVAVAGVGEAPARARVVQLGPMATTPLFFLGRAVGGLSEREASIRAVLAKGSPGALLERLTDPSHGPNALSSGSLEELARGPEARAEWIGEECLVTGSLQQALDAVWPECCGPRSSKRDSRALLQVCEAVLERKEVGRDPRLARVRALLCSFWIRDNRADKVDEILTWLAAGDEPVFSGWRAYVEADRSIAQDRGAEGYARIDGALPEAAASGDGFLHGMLLKLRLLGAGPDADGVADRALEALAEGPFADEWTARTVQVESRRLFELSRVEEAMAYVHRHLDTASTDEVVVQVCISALAPAHAARGAWDEARHWLNRSLEIADPRLSFNELGTRLGLLTCDLEQNRPVLDEARELADQIRASFGRVSPFELEVIAILARVLARSGEWTVVLFHLETLAAHRPVGLNRWARHHLEALAGETLPTPVRDALLGLLPRALLD